MKTFLSIIIVIVCHHTIAFGSEGHDSTKTYRFREVVISAVRSPLDLLHSPAKTSTIKKTEIENQNGTSLGEIIGVRSGLFIRDYGVGGSLQTVSFRGMSSEHSLVLLDGVPMNNVQTGLTDLRLIPVENVEQIEIVRGGNSPLYGSDALGGVISIRSENVLSPSFVRFVSGIGSFGARKFGITSHVLAQNNFGLTLGVSTDYGAGNYPFLYSQNGTSTEALRANSDYRSQNIFLSSEWHPAEETKMKFMISSFTTSRGTPGPLLTVMNQGTARQSDNQIQVVGSVNSQLSEKAQYSVTGSFQNAYEHYLDVSGLNPADNYYRNITFNVLSSLLYSLSPSVSMIPGLEFGHASANGNALQNRQTRSHIGMFLHSTISSELIPDVLKFSLYPSIRFDRYSANLEAWSPKIGATVMLLPGNSGVLNNPALTFHSTIGRNFRVPTFNEYYYAGSGGIGNPSLQPEHSVSFDAGMTLNYELLGKQEFDITYYSIDTDNRIIWLPTPKPFVYSPKNVGKTLSSGFEAEFRWDIAGGYVNLEGSYSLIDARKKNRESVNDPAFDKQLPYVPLETGNIGTTLQFPFASDILTKLYVRINDNFIGERYVVEGSNIVLPAQHVVQGNIGIEFRLFGTTSKLKYEVNNLTDISYEVMPRYPMPLRNQTVSLTVTKLF